MLWQITTWMRGAQALTWTPGRSFVTSTWRSPSPHTMLPTGEQPLHLPLSTACTNESPGPICMANTCSFLWKPAVKYSTGAGQSERMLA